MMTCQNRQTSQMILEGRKNKGSGRPLRTNQSLQVKYRSTT